MTSKTIYHYVYRITNLVENKHYYGKRSSKIHPHLDIGTKYFSSSGDKQFKQDQLDNPSHYKYKVVCVKESAQEAISFESKLHYLFDVARNQSFYNRCRQNSKGFDMTGTHHSEETRLKMSAAGKGKTLSEETRLKMSVARKGKTFSEETKQKLSAAKKGKSMGTPSEETKLKLSIANTGNTLSEETKLKISSALIGRTFSEETKQKLSAA